MGWKCRACGSWDVFDAVIGEGQDGDCNEQKQKVSFKDGFFDVSLSPGKKSGSKDCLGVNPPCDSQLKVLRDMLVNYPSSDCKCSSHSSSPAASRIPKSPLNNVEEGLHLSARSPGTGALVYPRRKKLGKAKLAVDARFRPCFVAGSGTTVVVGGRVASRSCSGCRWCCFALFYGFGKVE